MDESFVSIAPGRLCLFGEHQDYLGLPVVALALPLYCYIEVTPTLDDNNNNDDQALLITLDIPQLNQIVEYNTSKLPPRQGPNTENPDFALAALHEALDEGWTFDTGAIYCRSTTDLVMQAGCSTSSAFCVAWIQALAKLAGKKTLLPTELAMRAHRTEVLHFGAPGGTMDHVTSSTGGLLRIGPGPWQVENLPSLPTAEIGVWVLAYSGEPKDTITHLKRCKTARLNILEKIQGDWDNCELLDNLDADEHQLLKATLINRNTERKAVEIWKNQQATMKDFQSSTTRTSCLGERLGKLMLQHHEALANGLRLSTSKIDSMKHAAICAGAWGFKVVGSGGGGCAVAWTSSCTAEKIATVMESAGATKTWIIREPSAGAHMKPSTMTTS